MSLLDNLVSYLKLDENTGTNVNDEAGNGDGTFSGAGTHWTSSGKINAAGLFSSDSYVVIADAAHLDMTDGVSVSCWVYPTTINVNNQFVSKRASWGGDTIPFELTSTGSPDVYFSWRVIGNGNIITDTDIPLTINTWYHIVGTWDGTTQKLYINGTEEASASNTGTITANNTDVNIGRLPGGGENTDGRIDEVGIWSRGLSAAEVLELYNSGNGLSYPFSSSSTPKNLAQTFVG